MSLPIDQIQRIVEAVAEGINVAFKIKEGGGLLALISLTDEISALKGISKEALVLQLQDIDQAERKQLLSVLKSKLVLEDKALEAKIEAGADCLDEAIEIGFEAYELVGRGKALVEKVKNIGQVKVPA